MKTFLNIVASDLLQRFGNNMCDVTVVFPGKRASIFLNQELARCSTGPVWAPRYITMSDLFYRMSDMVAADPIDSIVTLHEVFCQTILNDEFKEQYTLDKFWSWGEVMLSDFDDIDKHLADAEAIFSNVFDLHQLESLEYLTDEQKDTLQHFFKNFSAEGNSVLKERFLEVWQNMYAIYTALREKQMQEGRVYEGALFRQVIEEVKKDDARLQTLLEDKKAIVFAGFNVLNNVEEELMTAIQKQGKALFYWDYDSFYVENENHEAGEFMRRNLKSFPSAIGKEEFDNLRHLKDVTFISCNSDNSAARYSHQWLSEKHDSQSNRNAVVLCNEGLLQPMLHAMPEDAGKVNVTMGFPLTDTPVYSLVMALISLQTDGFDAKQQRFRYPFVQVVQHHVYASYLEEEDYLRYQAMDNVQLLMYLINIIQKVGMHFSQIEEPNVYEQLYIEAIFQTNRILTKFLQLTSREANPLQIQHITLRRLVRSLLCSTNIPFHGEPASGLQVMGVLETRCLDFSHMLMLSVEEGMLPRNIQSNTMIPANLREAFGLTTPRHRIAVFSYYFYRLIQRTEHLTCVYNENCVGTSHHEMSRFLRQMLAETKIPIRTLWLRSQSEVNGSEELVVEKTPEVIERMLSLYDINTSGKDARSLSPTAINTYMNCPMSFFLKHISGLRADKDPQEGLDAPLIGDIFHDTAELIYKYIIQHTGKKVIQKATLSELLNNMEQTVGPILDIVFDTIYFHPVDRWKRTEIAEEMMKRDTRPGNQYIGELIIIRKVLMQYLTNLLRFDLRKAPFSIINTEKDYYFNIDVKPEGLNAISVKTGGRIDRLDEMDNHIRVVDYKSGAKAHTAKSMDNVTGMEGEHEGYFLQTFLYSYAVIVNEPPRFPVIPTLFYPAKAYTEDYDPSLSLGNTPIEDFTDIADEFHDGLSNIVKHIFSPSNKFTQTTDIKKCSKCDFKLLCGR